jgi:hypothetical protein
MNTLLKHLLGRTEEATSEYDDRCRPITGLDVLCCRQIDELSESVNIHHLGSEDVRPLTILEAGWRAWMLCRIVAPSFVTITSPFEVWICEDDGKKRARKTLDEISLTILSIPRGPSDVRTASLIATVHYYF